jgi:hypothetical protein
LAAARLARAFRRETGFEPATSSFGKTTVSVGRAAGCSCEWPKKEDFLEVGDDESQVIVYRPIGHEVADAL